MIERLRHGLPPRRLDFGDLNFTERPDSGGQRDEMDWVQEVCCTAALRRNAPEQKIANGRRDLRVRLLRGDDRVFVIDQRIRIGTRSEHERKALIGGVRGVSEAAAAVTVTAFGSTNFPSWFSNIAVARPALPAAAAKLAPI